MNVLPPALPSNMRQCASALETHARHVTRIIQQYVSRAEPLYSSFEMYQAGIREARYAESDILLNIFALLLKRSCWYEAGTREAKYAESVILLSIFNVFEEVVLVSGREPRRQICRKCDFA